MDWIVRFLSAVRLSFWRHPFTTEDPLVSKWCTATFLQIWWRNKLIHILDDVRMSTFSADFSIICRGWSEGEFKLGSVFSTASLICMKWAQPHLSCQDYFCLPSLFNHVKVIDGAKNNTRVLSRVVFIWCQSLFLIWTMTLFQPDCNSIHLYWTSDIILFMLSVCRSI